MDSLFYLTGILSFIVGCILGLLTSYKWHGEAFIISKIDLLALIIAIVGWILLVNYGLISQIIGIFPSIYYIVVGLFLIAFVFGMRPGYGRKETFIGILLSLFIWVISYLIL